VRRFLASAFLVAFLAQPALADRVSIPGVPGSIGGGGGVSYPPGSSGGACSQATAFIGRTSGLTTPQKTAYTTLICGIVTDGNWNALDALWVATGGASNYVLNLVSGSYSLTVHGTVTYNAPGWTSDGSTGYYSTGYIPGSGQFTLNSAALSSCVLVAAASPSSWNEAGMIHTAFSSYTQLQAQSGPQMDWTINAGSGLGYPVANVVGAWAAVRTAAGAEALYLNGASVMTNTEASISLQDVELYILAGNFTGGPANYSKDTNGYAWIGSAAASVSQMYSRLHTFMASMGASAC
jgi:hypothetical protein